MLQMGIGLLLYLLRNNKIGKGGTVACCKRKLVFYFIYYETTRSVKGIQPHVANGNCSFILLLRYNKIGKGKQPHVCKRELVFYFIYYDTTRSVKGIQPHVANGNWSFTLFITKQQDRQRGYSRTLQTAIGLLFY